MLLDSRIPFWYILNKIKYDLVSVISVSVIILSITYRYANVLPEFPLTIPVFLGTAISVLLSFKLSQSYDRWWEARKIWGSIVNDSRTLVLQVKNLPAAGNDEVLKRVAYRQMAWCYSLSQALRGKDAMENLHAFLSADEIHELQPQRNKSLYLLDLNSRDIKSLVESNELSVFGQIQIDNTLVRLCDSQGAAERIKSTVFPVTYRKFLHFLIYLFVITLSIALNNLPGYYEAPILILISSVFFLLEKSATHMQDPFENRPTDTAMSTIARNIEINLRQLIGENQLPEPLPNGKFYVM